MSDLRHDPIDDIWVTMAGNRRSRPMEFVTLAQRCQAMICPFCGGNEAEAAAPIVVFGEDGQVLEMNSSIADQSTEIWSSRAIANKYPSFSIDRQGESSPSLAPSSDHDWPAPVQVNQSPGLQELIIPTPRHCDSISGLNDNELEVAFLAIQHRLNAIRTEAEIAHAMLFLNCRAEAGASLGHVHWQLIGTPVVSSQLQRRAAREQDHQSEFGRSLIGSLVDWELKQQTRIVCETENFVVYCPFASRFPFQIHITPRDPSLSLFDCPADIRNELAWHCRDAVKRLETLLEDAAYNILLQLPPMERVDQDPWYMQIFPRISKPAGFELGSDIWINPVTPEAASQALRSSTVWAADQSQRNSN